MGERIVFKKLLSSVLVVIFVFTVTLSVPAFADENTVLREKNIVMVKYDTKTRETTKVEIDPNISKRNSAYNTMTEDGAESKGYHPITAEVLPTKVATESARSYQGKTTAITNTNYDAYRSTVFILAKRPNGKWVRGTGFMIGPNAVATAGHVIYNTEKFGGFTHEVKVYPAKTGDSEPYGPYTTTSYSVANEWADSENDNYDWGLIELGTNIGYTVGWMALKTQTTTYNGTYMRLNGYPGKDPNEEYTEVLYRSNGKINASYTYLLQSTNTIASSGMSGGPVYIEQNDVYKIIGLHKGRNSSNESYFTRITSTVYNVYMLYRNITA